MMFLGGAMRPDLALFGPGGTIPTHDKYGPHGSASALHGKATDNPQGGSKRARKRGASGHASGGSNRSRGPAIKRPAKRRLLGSSISTKRPACGSPAIIKRSAVERASGGSERASGGSTIMRRRSASITKRPASGSIRSRSPAIIQRSVAGASGSSIMRR